MLCGRDIYIFLFLSADISITFDLILSASEDAWVLLGSWDDLDVVFIFVFFLIWIFKLRKLGGQFVCFWDEDVSYFFFYWWLVRSLSIVCFSGLFLLLCCTFEGWFVVILSSIYNIDSCVLLLTTLSHFFNIYKLN